MNLNKLGKLSLVGKFLLYPIPILFFLTLIVVKNFTMALIVGIVFGPPIGYIIGNIVAAGSLLFE